MKAQLNEWLDMLILFLFQMDIGLGYRTQFSTFQHHMMEMLVDTMPKNFKSILSHFTTMDQVSTYLQDQCHIKPPTQINLRQTVQIVDHRPTWEKEKVIKRNLIQEDVPLHISDMFDAHIS